MSATVKAPKMVRLEHLADFKRAKEAGATMVAEACIGQKIIWREYLFSPEQLATYKKGDK